MNNILHKIYSQRTAIAQAELFVSKAETILAIQNKQVPKGDVFEFSRAAGLLAIKKTSDVIPDCHPLPIEQASITYQVEGLSILIEVEVATIYKTGVEVEAMHGAAITALTMYDMLKPIDKGIEIKNIRLKEKQGGKNDFNDKLPNALKVAMIICSDSIAAGKKEDKAGKAVVECLKKYDIEVQHSGVIPDEFTIIQTCAKDLCNQNYDLLFFCGGTGLSNRDVTPDAIRPLIEREVSGIMEAARSYGQQRTPYAMLSRGVSGFMKNTLIITLPGSTRGAVETVQALFPALKHVFRVADGLRHD